MISLERYWRGIASIISIADLLENYAFRVETQEDNLTARVENEGSEFMCDRLKILGYLSLHTRQIDMIMKKPDLNLTRHESYSMTNTTEADKECTLIVRRMDIIFSEKQC